MSISHGEIAAFLAREPFVPFVLMTTDGRSIAVKDSSCAVLNSLAISIVEEAFSVTVIGLHQVEAIH